jgi:putative transcriptional regulator
LAAAAILAPATLLHAARTTEKNVPERIWLTGQLLIASTQPRQPIYNHAVILLARHDREGAFGIIINRPLRKKPIARLLAALGADASGITGSVRVFVGGPIEPTVGLVVHSTDYRRPDTLEIDGRVALTAAASDVLRDIGLGKGPDKSLVVFGYAGWGPSQLDDEIAHGLWTTVPEDPALVFDADRAKVWADALARRKATP